MKKDKDYKPYKGGGKVKKYKTGGKVAGRKPHRGGRAATRGTTMSANSD